MSLQDFQEEQKKILSLLPPLKSKYIHYADVSFSGMNEKKVIFKGLDGKDLKKAIAEGKNLLSYFDESVLDPSLVYIHAYFDTGKYYSIKESGSYEILIEGNGENVVKNLIVIESGVVCNIFFKITGKGKLWISNTIYAKEKSKSSFGSLHEFQGNLFYYNRGFAESGSNFNFYHGAFSSGLSRVYHELYFLGDMASGNIYDIYACKGEMDLNSRVYCKAKRNKSILLSKGIVTGNSVFEGYAKIDKGADEADLFVGEHALVLGGKANLVPNLEIEHQNVKAGHSASVRQFDDDTFFYLQSRGLGSEEARKLLIEGFFVSIVDKIDFPHLQAEIQRRI